MKFIFVLCGVFTLCNFARAADNLVIASVEGSADGYTANGLVRDITSGVTPEGKVDIAVEYGASGSGMLDGSFAVYGWSQAPNDAGTGRIYSKQDLTGASGGGSGTIRLNTGSTVYLTLHFKASTESPVNPLYLAVYQLAQDSAVLGAVPVPKFVTVSLRNTSGVPVTYKLVGAAGPDAPLAQVTLQAGAAVIQKWQVPDGVDPATLQIVSQVTGYTVGDGGSWIVEEGAVTTQTVAPLGAITGGMLTEGEETEPTPEQVVPASDPTDAPSDGPAGASSGGTVWHEDKPAEATDVLTRETFREGVDKLQKTMVAVRDAINGTPQTQVTFDSTASSDYIMPMVTLPVLGAVAKLPEPPAINLPTSSSTFAMTFTPPGLDSAQTIAFDLAEYDAGINIFKAIVRAVLAVWFFFIAVKSLRGAFAG